MEKQETVKLIEEVLQKHGLIEKPEELKEADVKVSVEDNVVRGVFIDEVHKLCYDENIKTWDIISTLTTTSPSKALLQPCEMSDLKPGDFYVYKDSEATDCGLVVELLSNGFIAEELEREAYPYRRTAPYDYGESDTGRFYKLIPKG